MQEFGGKVAVVTGAGSGMGRAFARRFAREGMKVAVADIQANALQRTVAELAADGCDVIAVQADVSVLADVERLADAALAAFGKVHVVCNNAGVEGYHDGAIWEASASDWAWTMDVNFTSVVHGIRVFVPLLLSHDEDGHIVNTASMTSLTAGRSMYGISKHAVLALTETLAADLAARGSRIEVSALLPGIVATNLFRGSRNRPPALRGETAGPGTEAGRAFREQMHARLAAGMPPDVVAGMLIGAIRARQLYVLTDHDWDERICERHAAILDGAPPSARPAAGKP